MKTASYGSLYGIVESGKDGEDHYAGNIYKKGNRIDDGAYDIYARSRKTDGKQYINHDKAENHQHHKPDKCGLFEILLK